LGWYGVFFKEIGAFQDAVNGAVWGRGDPQFGTFPFDGGDAGLGIRIFFQLDPEFLDQGDKVWWGFMRSSKRSPGVVLEPILIAGLEAVEPFEEPGFGSP